MSLTVTTAVWKKGPRNAALRLVLLSLADFADSSGRANVPVPVLANRVCGDLALVRDMLQRLEASGWIQISRDDADRLFCQIQLQRFFGERVAATEGQQ
jgi:hypothetical protein